MYSKQKKEIALKLYHQTESVSETIRILGYPTRKNLYNWIYEEANPPKANNIGGNGSFSVGGRDFDGGVGNRWWEAKSGQYWDMLENNPNKLAKFKSDMGDRLRIATENNASYEIFSNTPIPDSIKTWLTKRGIPFTEILD